jgi:energy-coupling factor transporter ATP-binding protein EcfA2
MGSAVNGPSRVHLLDVRSLTHRFSDGVLGLDQVSFAVDAGELILLAGRNGSGKTLLMKHLNGLLVPGEVLLEGRPITKDLAEARRRIGLVFQDADSQIVGQTVRDDVAFGPRNLRLEPAEVERRTSEVLRTVGLEAIADRPPQLLSGGEKRRLGIAGVLAMEPDLIILDEPFSALDYPGVVQVLEEIVRLHDAGQTLIIITHEIEKILGHATRLLVMESGRLTADGEPCALLDCLEPHGIRRPFVDGRGVGGVTWLR